MSTYVTLNLLCLQHVSCKQTATNSDLWGFLEKSCFDGSFGVCLAAFLIVTVFIWANGYKVLEWYRHKLMSTKVVFIFFFLAILFSFGCISQDRDSQYYGGWFALPVAMAIGSTIIVGWSILQRYQYRFTNRNNKSSLPELYRRQRNLVLLAKVMLWIWSCGWVLYFVAIGVIKPPHVGAELLLRSAIASLSMFLMNIDSNIVDGLEEHDVLKGMIVCTCFSAVICTALLIMSLVLSRLMAYLHIKHLKIDNNRNHLYLFFGLNDASKLLANDILKKDNNSVVVFVENSLAGEAMQNEDRTDGWKNIVNMMTHRRKTFLDVNEDERRALAIASCDICGLESGFDDVFGNIGLETVKRLLTSLGDTKKAQLHIFFLSENRDSNVRATAILAKDEMINSPRYKTIIYCHARRNSVNRIIEDLGIGEEKQTEVRILDSSYLSIQWLKIHPEYHPVQFVCQSKEEQNRGVVNNKFNALVVGFGETGREAASFLYEFAAFVTDKQVRSPFMCHIVDPNVNALKSEFLVNRPAFKGKHEFDFMEVSDKNGDYWGKLEEIIPSLQYVIVSTGSDELNMKIAVDLYQLAIRCKDNNLSNFKIFVRSYSKKNEQLMEKTANFYNEKNGVSKGEIVVFGKMTDIYTYDIIVLDKVLREAKRYGDKYYVAYEKLESIVGKENKELTGLAEIRKKHRSLSQDIANSLHASTKFLLMGLDEEKLLRIFTGKDLTEWEQHVKSLLVEISNFSDAHEFLFGKDYEAIKGNDLKLLMYNMALCEHLRWNAAHEMMGYTYGEEKNEVVKRHDCLTEYSKLPKFPNNARYDKGVYDFLVLETSIKLKMEECNEIMNKQKEND